MVLTERSLGLLAVVLLLWLPGCGGSAKIDANPHPSAGATSGGAASVAGSGGTTVGQGAVGGVGGSTPSAGGSSSAGAPAADICGLPWAGGDCDAAIQSYWYNAVNGQCERRSYGGCGGNANRFGSLEECLTACRVSGDPNTTCNRATDCELRGAGCCRSCEPVAADSLIAVTHAAITPDCSGTCVPCLPVEANESTGRYFMPGCVAHQCIVVDIRETAITECATNSDCELRTSATCCERCAPSGDPIAYNKSIDQVAAFCGGAAQPCSFCLVQRPEGFSSACRAGRCVVELLNK